MRHTRIIYNGPILDERKRSIEELIDMLKKEPLFSDFEVGKGFIYPDETTESMVFAGCFASIQFRFRIETDDPTVIEQLTPAIQANLASNEYKKLRTLRFSRSYRKALVKQVESGDDDTKAAVFLKTKYKVEGRPESFYSIYEELDWKEGKWISTEDLLHCTLDLCFDIVLTSEDRFPRD